MEDGKHTDLNGTIKYYKNGKLHRVNDPAVILTDGSEFYYQNGKRHREDGPAVIDVDGTREFYMHDNLVKKGSENYEEFVDQYPEYFL